MKKSRPREIVTQLSPGSSDLFSREISTINTASLTTLSPMHGTFIIRAVIFYRKALEF